MEQNKKQKKWKSWILALLSSIALIYYFQVSTGNFAGIVFLFALFYFYSHMEMVTEARAKICAFAGGAVCSMALVFGKVGRSSESILDALSRFSDSVIKDEHTADVALNGYYTVKNLLVLFVTFVGLGIVCYHLLLKTAFLLRHVNITMQERQEKRNGKIFLLSFCSILICWMPCFLLNFPGVLTYDSINQISQIEGSIPLNNHHPPIHTAMIALFYNAGRFFFHSSQIGTAFCSMAQMILLALIYSELIVLIYRSGFHKICSGLVWAYFALLPLHAVYAVTMWKDILSAASVLWFSMTVYKMFVWKEAGSLVLIQYVVSGTMLALFRSNGSIVFILCIPYFIFLCRKKMRNVIFLILPVFCFLIVKGPVYDFFHVQKTTDIVERISIPMQHIARVVVNCEQELEADETELIEQAASLEDIKRTYNCRFSDPIKNLMWKNGSSVVIEEQKWEYLMLWFRLGLKHPVQFLLAQIDATVGYWYPDVQYPTLFYGVYPNDFGIYTSINQEGKIWKKAQQWNELYRTIPVLGNFYSIGTVFLLMALSILKFIYEKQWNRIAVVLPAFMSWFTIMIATPLHAEMRYVYGMMVTIPLILVTVLLPKKNQQKRRQQAD